MDVLKLVIVENVTSYDPTVFAPCITSMLLWTKKKQLQLVFVKYMNFFQTVCNVMKNRYKRENLSSTYSVPNQQMTALFLLKASIARNMIEAFQFSMSRKGVNQYSQKVVIFSRITGNMMHMDCRC